MPHIDTIYGGNRIKAEDLAGDDLMLSIKAVHVRNFAKEEEDLPDRKLILTFEQRDDTMPLNVTNATQLADNFGTDYSKWPGQKITLYPTTCLYKGNPRTPCIRIRESVNGQNVQPTAAPTFSEEDLEDIVESYVTRIEEAADRGALVKLKQEARADAALAGDPLEYVLKKAADRRTALKTPSATEAGA